MCTLDTLYGSFVLVCVFARRHHSVTLQLSPHRLHAACSRAFDPSVCVFVRIWIGHGDRDRDNRSGNIVESTRTRSCCRCCHVAVVFVCVLHVAQQTKATFVKAKIQSLVGILMSLAVLSTTTTTNTTPRCWLRSSGGGAYCLDRKR